MDRWKNSLGVACVTYDGLCILLAYLDDAALINCVCFVEVVDDGGSLGGSLGCLGGCAGTLVDEDVADAAAADCLRSNRLLLERMAAQRLYQSKWN